MEETTITIEEKRPYTGNAERHPTGDFFCNKVKYTYWEDDFDSYKVGDVIKFSYTMNENVSGGKTYTNRNISKMLPLGNSTTDVGMAVPVSQIASEAATKSHQDGTDNIDIISKIYRFGDLEYEVTVRLLK